MVCNSTEHGLTEMLNKHVYSSLSRFYLMLAIFKAFSYFSWRRLQCDFPSIAQGRVWLLRLSSCWKDRQMEELMEKGNGIKREVGQLHLNGWMDGWMDTSWAKKNKTEPVLQCEKTAVLWKVLVPTLLDHFRQKCYCSKFGHMQYIACCEILVSYVTLFL